MSDLTRTEQEFLARFGSYLILDLVANPTQHEAMFSRQRDGMSGATCDYDGRRGWASTTRKGLGWSEHTISGYHAAPEAFAIFVTWARLSEHARRMTTPDRTERAKVHRARVQAHQLGSQSWVPDWRGVPFIVPRNPAGMTREEVAVWHQNVHMPEFRAIQAESRALREELLPLLHDDEPVDLLELLGAME